MASTASAPESTSPHAFVVNVSALFCILIFLQQMWSGASLNHVLLTAATSGIVAYLALIIGYAGARRILAQAPNADASEGPPDASQEQESDDVDPDEAANASEPQVA